MNDTNASGEEPTASPGSRRWAGCLSTLLFVACALFGPIEFAEFRLGASRSVAGYVLLGIAFAVVVFVPLASFRRRIVSPTTRGRIVGAISGAILLLISWGFVFGWYVVSYLASIDNYRFTAPHTLSQIRNVQWDYFHDPENGGSYLSEQEFLERTGPRVERIRGRLDRDRPGVYEYTITVRPATDSEAAGYACTAIPRTPYAKALLAGYRVDESTIIRFYSADADLPFHRLAGQPVGGWNRPQAPELDAVSPVAE